MTSTASGNTAVIWQILPVSASMRSTSPLRKYSNCLGKQRHELRLMMDLSQCLCRWFPLKVGFLRDNVHTLFMHTEHGIFIDRIPPAQLVKIISVEGYVKASRRV